MHSLMKDDIGTHLFLLYLEKRNASSLPPLWLQGMAFLEYGLYKKIKWNGGASGYGSTCCVHKRHGAWAVLYGVKLRMVGEDY